MIGDSIFATIVFYWNHHHYNHHHYSENKQCLSKVRRTFCSSRSEVAATAMAAAAALALGKSPGLFLCLSPLCHLTELASPVPLKLAPAADVDVLGTSGTSGTGGGGLGLGLGLGLGFEDSSWSDLGPDAYLTPPQSPRTPRALSATVQRAVAAAAAVAARDKLSLGSVSKQLWGLSPSCFVTPTKTPSRVAPKVRTVDFNAVSGDDDDGGGVSMPGVLEFGGPSAVTEAPIHASPAPAIAPPAPAAARSSAPVFLRRNVRVLVFRSSQSMADRRTPPLSPPPRGRGRRRGTRRRGQRSSRNPKPNPWIDLETPPPLVFTTKRSRRPPPRAMPAARRLDFTTRPTAVSAAKAPRFHRFRLRSTPQPPLGTANDPIQLSP